MLGLLLRRHDWHPRGCEDEEEEEEEHLANQVKEKNRRWRRELGTARGREVES